MIPLGGLLLREVLLSDGVRLAVEEHCTGRQSVGRPSNKTGFRSWFYHLLAVG